MNGYKTFHIPDADEAYYAKVRAQFPDSAPSEKLTEMLAARSAPKAQTDREFFAGQGTLADQFSGNDDQLNKVIGNAKKHGYKPQYTDTYVPALAKFAGDPAAFVSASGGRGHVQRVCERRGWTCNGSVNVKGRPSDPGPDTVLGENLVQEAVDNLSIKNPDLARKATKRELREEAIHQHKMNL